MWIALPMPMVPPVALLGLAFSQAISSLVSLAGKSLRADDPERADRQHRDRLEILEVVERQRIHRGGADMRAPLADDDGVAVGRRAEHPRDADGAAGAADVLDDHRLAERGLHMVADDARDDVGDAAGRERHDQGHGLRRKGLRLRAEGASRAPRRAPPENTAAEISCASPSTGEASMTRAPAARKAAGWRVASCYCTLMP